MCIWLGLVLQPCCNPYFKGTIIPSQITGAGRAAELASELSGMSLSFAIHMKIGPSSNILRARYTDFAKVGSSKALY